MTESIQQNSSSTSKNQLRLLDSTLEALHTLFTKGNLPANLDKSITENPNFKELVKNLKALRQFTLALSNGDLSEKLDMKGTLAGSLKNLQSSLLHLTWQTKKVSEGDFTQHVDFMGEFSAAFNDMVKGLADTREELQKREKDLVKVNNELIQENTERKRIEEKLREANEHLQHRIEEIETLQKQLQDLAIRDGLTGLFNRRYLSETLEREIIRARRASTPVAIIMLDIDKFKNVNDTYGHKGGDVMLQALSNLLSTRTRADDIACRYGGEEFAIVMPGASLQVAQKRAESLRISFMNLKTNYKEHILQATISLGIAVFPIHGEKGDDVLNHADKALYQAKQAGRNRVVLFNQD